jgi:predicted lipoprotein with Yx(FWY)xxD motif
MRKIWGVAGLAALALSLSACASSGSTSAAAGNTPAAAASSPAAPAPAASAPAGSAPAGSSAGTTLAVKTIAGQQVVTNSQGFTLYWFAPDTSTTSKCTGSCATYWPPVKGPATAMSGVTGKLGTITRSDGTTQVTYDGHPLYTYAADSAPGQAKGNGLNASGGLWYEMTVSGATPAAAAAKATASAKATAKTGGGYGY